MQIPALVSVETWEQAQRQCKANHIMAPHHVKNEYLLRYLLSCRHCGRSIGATTSMCNNKAYSYYACYDRMSHLISPREKCMLPYFRVDHTDAAVWEWIKSFLVDPKALIQGLEEQKARQEESCNPARERLAVIEELLTDNQGQIERLLDLYLAGDFAKEVLVGHKARLEATREALKTEQDNLATRLEARTITDEQVATSAHTGRAA